MLTAVFLRSGGLPARQAGAGRGCNRGGDLLQWYHWILNGPPRGRREGFMDLNVVFFVVIVVGAGLLAFALTLFLINLYRQDRKGPGGAAAGKKKGEMPNDEHKGAEGVVRAVRRFAAAEGYAAIAPVQVQGTRDAADLDVVLVGWFGVLGVKCLGYGGDVYGSADEPQWTQVLPQGRRSFENPMTRAGKSARALRDALFAARLKNVSVETAVVFTNPSAALNLPRSTGHYTEKTFLAWLKSGHFLEDKKVEVEPVAAALRQQG